MSSRGKQGGAGRGSRRRDDQQHRGGFKRNKVDVKEQQQNTEEGEINEKETELEEVEEDSIVEEEEEDVEEEEEETPSSCFFTETDLGVARFVNNSGYGLVSGTLKCIPQDFYVFEVEKDGTIVKLTTPVVAPTKVETSSSTTTTTTTGVTGEKTTEDRIKEFETLLTSNNITCLTSGDYQNLLTILTDNESELKEIVFENIVTDKNQRGFIHKTIRSCFYPLITSSTTSDSKISIQKASQQLLRRDERRSRFSNGGKDEPHLEFICRKTNVDSNHCLTELARISKYPRKSFCVAGSKDKRAVTTQKITIRNGSMKEFTSRFQQFDKIICGMENQFVQVGNCKQIKNTNFLGNLKGNRFCIVIKQLLMTENHSASLLANMLNNWSFLNYYGAQRFGTAEVGTHQVGVALLNRKFDIVIDLILKPRKGEDDRLNKIRKEYQEDKSKTDSFLKSLPYRCTAERAVVQGLIRFKEDDLWKPLELIPRNTMTMYLHAVQSLIWNKIATLRYDLYGHDTPLVGDLVLDKNGKIQKIKNQEQVKLYKIEDVVLPLPGHDVEYPSLEKINSTTYDELLKEIGIVNGLQQLSEKTLKPRELLLTGSYRTFICTPENVQSKIVKYDKEDQILLTEEGDIPTTEGNQEGSKQALLLAFTLPSGNYATMAIRELLHSSS